jgi:hypothetical protein
VIPITLSKSLHNSGFLEPDPAKQLRNPQRCRRMQLEEATAYSRLFRIAGVMADDAAIESGCIVHHLPDPAPSEAHQIAGTEYARLAAFRHHMNVVVSEHP